MQELKYIEQYKRVKRWYKRFEDITNGKTHNLDSDNYQDEMYAFFINCYHLKDWIKNDDASQISKELVENYVNSNESLMICGDLCNGTKHLNLNSPKVGAGAKFGTKFISLELGVKDPHIHISYKIRANGKIYDAFKTATEALDLWETFLCNGNNDFKVKFEKGIFEE